jgi:hypothetical protein
VSRLRSWSAIACVACGCAPPVVIGAHDTTFARAQHRLEVTAVAVDALAPPPDERALFLQAEAFHRYRFAFAARGGLAYAGEIAAAVTDFPALQSFAGGFDLLELRLRADDAAVQLWETLLANRPATRLRPLALYRLGWAYRSASVSGLPRRSGDDAFDAVAAEAPGTRLGALSIEAKRVPGKSKRVAAAWSLVPGLGQLYVGEKLSGTVRLGVGLASLAAIAVPIYVGYQRRGNLSWSGDWPLLATGVAGLIVLSIDYTASYEDAMRGVVEHNERAEAAFEGAHPDAP